MQLKWIYVLRNFYYVCFTITCPTIYDVSRRVVVKKTAVEKKNQQQLWRLTFLTLAYLPCLLGLVKRSGIHDGSSTFQIHSYVHNINFMIWDTIWYNLKCFWRRIADPARNDGSSLIDKMCQKRTGDISDIESHSFPRDAQNQGSEKESFQGKEALVTYMQRYVSSIHLTFQLWTRFRPSLAYQQPVFTMSASSHTINSPSHWIWSNFKRPCRTRGNRVTINR